MKINFEKMEGLVPAIVQDVDSAKVLMLGFMNEEAYQKTQSTGKVTFYSRSKKRIWVKGETSGNFLHVVSILHDCDQDTLLIKATPEGPVCHKGSDTCFDEKNIGRSAFINYLTEIIKDRHENPSETSYTTSLFRKGINKIAQKVGEEAVELVIEAKDDNDELFRNEAADLFFHLLVLLEARGITFDEVIDELKMRHQAS